MAAYAKIQKACRDFTLGFQTINQARDNLQVIADDYSAEHNIFPQELPAGMHWTQNVPKAQGTVQVGAATPSVTSWAAEAILAQVSKSSGVGVWFISTPLHGPLWCDVAPIANNGTPVRIVNARTVQTGQMSVIAVYCLELVAGSFVLADYSFSFVVFGGG